MLVLQRRIDDQEAVNKRQEDEIGGLQAEINGLRDTNGQLQAEIDGLQGRVKRLEGEYEELRPNVKRLETEREDYNRLNDRIMGLEEEMDAQDRIQSEELKALDEKIKAHGKMLEWLICHHEWA